jgi:hypothetical protein
MGEFQATRMSSEGHRQFTDVVQTAVPRIALDERFLPRLSPESSDFRRAPG